MDDALLDVKDIHVFYGNIEAVKACPSMSTGARSSA